MIKSILPVLACCCLLQITYGQRIPEPRATPATMDQLSPFFTFTAKNQPQRTLTKSDPKSVFIAGKKSDGFTIKIQADLKDLPGEHTLLEIPGLLILKLKQTDPGQRDRQNYPAFPLPDGSVPVLEATLTLSPPEEKVFSRDMTIGFPLAALEHPWGEHEIILNFTGVRWTIYADRQLMDNDFGIGYPNFGDDNEWELNAGFVSQAGITFPAMIAERDTTKHSDGSPAVQYWTPVGHNSWVGDVATSYFQGRYHVFYLYDRRHHASKFGVGGHYFEHFSTADFKTWTEHEAAVPIEEQWETIGTGTPFVWNNALHIAYGLHTARIFPDDRTMTIQQKAYYESHGKTGAFPFDLTKGYPSGATYAVSQNGISDFRKSRNLFHYCENPSVYIDPDGKLKMIANFRAKGMWASETLDSNWQSISADFPPGGDCTFYFRWGKFDYIIGGFVNLWNKPASDGNDAWVDQVKAGRDFYNGINVPAITKIKDDRYLMAGWFPIRNGWGGPFVVHELIQLPDGRIRTKWMRELTPLTRDTILLAKRPDKTVSFPVADESFIISFDVHPNKKKSGMYSLSFLPSGGQDFEKGCEFKVDAQAQTAQYGQAVKEGFAAPEPSLRQEGSPQTVGNYAIEQLTGLQRPYSVRLLVKRTAKLGGTIIDAEIAGQNTMITYRQDLSVAEITFRLSDTDIRNIRLMKVDNK